MFQLFYSLYSSNYFFGFCFVTNSPPVEWYRNYASLRHLLNPISFSTPTGITQSNNSTTKSNNNISNGSNNYPKKSGVTSSTSSGIIAASAISNMSATTKSSGPTSISTANTNFAFPKREDCRVLIVGCGNSILGEDMIRDGWTGPMVQVDYSPIVIDQMKARYSNSNHDSGKDPQRVATGNSNNNQNSNSNNAIQRMEFICADITNESVMIQLFQSSSFDLIICKGIFDAILNTSTPLMNMQRAIQQCHRMLTDTYGILFILSNGNPDNRLEYLEYSNNLHYYWSSVGIHSMMNQQNNSNKNSNHRNRSSHSSNKNNNNSSSAAEK